MEPLTLAEIRRRLGPGAYRRIAEACSIRPQAVSQWTVVPLERVPAVEAATGIPRHELRPDYWPKS